jgi:4'-phosphopantetheinyl transferase
MSQPSDSPFSTPILTNGDVGEYPDKGLPPGHRILVLSIGNEALIQSSFWTALRDLLPIPMLPQIDRYHRWQDRQASLLGRSLVQLILKEEGYDSKLLSSWKTDHYNRPSLEVDFDFNISHCPGMVACAFFRPGPIGIDIEPIRPVRPYDFRSVLTPEELDLLQKLPDRQCQHLFGTIWTRKEAAIKADGKGFSNTLTDVSGLGTSIRLEGRTWAISEVPLPDPYICHLATSRRPKEIIYRHLTIEQLTDYDKRSSR